LSALFVVGVSEKDKRRKRKNLTKATDGAREGGGTGAGSRLITGSGAGTTGN